ncbi:adhesion G protein-coupled receptor E3-like [Elgaria multicarinata webbii]|uniref:adhesion G protein-coupled receptor E3-like n=1 Tax=Elgaria multicarinata webbii TaxID=159646 RepID=UPI002FCCD217
MAEIQQASGLNPGRLQPLRGESDGMTSHPPHRRCCHRIATTIVARRITTTIAAATSPATTKKCTAPENQAMISRYHRGSVYLVLRSAVFPGHGGLCSNAVVARQAVMAAAQQATMVVAMQWQQCTAGKIGKMNNSYSRVGCGDDVVCGQNADAHIESTCECSTGYVMVFRSNESYCKGSGPTGHIRYERRAGKMPILEYEDDEGTESSGGGSRGDIGCSSYTSHYTTFICVCQEGYRVAYHSNEPHCEKIPFHCQSENNIVKMCLNATTSDYCSMVKSTFHVLNSACKNDNSTTTSLEDTAVSFEKYFVNSSLQSIKVKEDLVSAVTFVLQGLGSTAVTAALASPEKQPQTVVTESIVIQTNLINEESISKNETFRLEARGEQMAIHPRALTDGTTKGPLAVAFISYGGLKSLLGENFLQNGTLLSNEMLKSIRVNSRVVSASTSNSAMNISSPVKLTFHHLEKNDPQEKVMCVHWNSASRGGAWSSKGCQHLRSNGTHSTCSCRFLPNFAMLMAITPTEGDLVLFIIGQVGLIISLIFLFLTIVTFLLCRSSRNNSTFIHLQLSLSLFFADLLFIIGSDKTHNKILCSIIAGMLQYLFLACFVWMFFEGVNLFLIVRNLKVANYTGASKYVKTSMYVGSYGIPAMIVAISAAIDPGAYGTPYQCWLNFEKGFIWSFLGPVCAIIVINLLFYCLILKNLHEKLACLNANISAVRNTRLLTFKAVAHVFILGVTWCLGLFQFGPAAMVMAYLFTLTNSVQGIFIFLVHCLLNKKVRETYWQWISCSSKDIKPPVTEMTLSSVPISSATKNEESTASLQQKKVGWGEEPSSNMPPD